MEFADRQHILYVNASYEGEDPIGDLMHDFLCSDPEDMKTKLLADKARYLKNDPERAEAMCAEMEKMRDEVEQRTILAAIKNIMKKLKYTAEQAMDLLEIPPPDEPSEMALG